MLRDVNGQMLDAVSAKKKKKKDLQLNVESYSLKSICYFCQFTYVLRRIIRALPVSAPKHASVTAVLSSNTHTSTV